MYPERPVAQILWQRASQLIDRGVDCLQIALKLPVQRGATQQLQNLVPGYECSPPAAHRHQFSDRPSVNRNLHPLAAFDGSQHLTYAVAQLTLRNSLHYNCSKLTTAEDYDK